MVAVLVAVGLAAAVYLHPLPQVSEEGRRLTALLVAVATLWIAEVLPLSVTAILAPSFAVLAGIASAEQAFSAFGNPIIMLFIGSFLLARATFKHHLNERIAYRVLSLGILENSPTRAFVFLGATSAGLSAWMSNTAVTAMMLPVAQSVLLAMAPAEGAVPRVYAAAMMLIVAYSASIGGLFTPIGTPPNLIGIGLLEQATGKTITFAEWIVQVFPVTAVALAAMTAYLALIFRHERSHLVYDRSQMVARYGALGRWRPAEKRVMTALALTVTFWLLPSLVNLADAQLGRFLLARAPEAVVPLVVAGALFLVRRGEPGRDEAILDVRDLAHIDWPVIVLFGGGMCLGHLMIQTGMAKALGEALSVYLPAHGGIGLVFIVCALAVVVSETTSNTASANMVIPIVLAISASVGADPVHLAIAATAACTFGFMLPVSTPTNALAYATGWVPQRQMIRWGVILDLIGVVLLSLWFGLVL
jgi:sodium-dependent dicarboxylate transporter 2/3/5